MHLAAGFLPRLKLCIWHRTSGAGFGGQTAQALPPRCQELGSRLPKVSSYLPAAAICPFPSCTPYSCQRGRGALGSLGDSLGLSTFYWRQRDLESGEGRTVWRNLCLSLHKADRGSPSSLCLRKAPGSASTRLPFAQLLFGFSPGKEKGGGKKKKGKPKKRWLNRGCALCPRWEHVSLSGTAASDGRNGGESSFSAPREHSPP